MSAPETLVSIHACSDQTSDANIKSTHTDLTEFVLSQMSEYLDGLSVNDRPIIGKNAMQTFNQFDLN